MVGCFVPGCKTGHKSGKGTHLFCAKRKTGHLWTDILRQVRTDKLFDPKNRNHRVCSLHFDEESLVKNDTFTIKGELAQLARQNWTLQKNAVPTIFPGIPKSIQPKVPRKRREIVKVSEPVKKKRRLKDGTAPEPAQQVASPENDGLLSDTPTCNVKIDLQDWWNQNKSRYPQWNFQQLDKIQCLYIVKLKKGQLTIHKSLQVSIGENGFDGHHIFVDGVNVTEKITAIVSSSADFCNLVEAISALNCCQGIEGFNNIESLKGGVKVGDAWHSASCTAIGDLTVCIPCKTMYHSLNRKDYTAIVKTATPPACQHKSRKLRYYVSRTKQLTKERRCLRSEIVRMKSSLHKLSITDVVKKLEDTVLSPPMKSNILHCLQTIKRKSSKGMRYSSDWLLECLLLKIKSPNAYRHLREAKVLPLPHPNSLSKLIASQRCEFGFNETALDAIKRELKGKPRRDRQGMLIFDEIQLRETINFNKGTHRFDGYVDYGEYTNECSGDPDSPQLANHALVLMYRPYNSNWVQPIAAFATKNAATGTALHKIVLEAIVKLEDIGAEILTVVCDGSKPNKACWKLFGIGLFGDEIINKVQHPCDETRSLFFSCDFPHLFKCIRNHVRKYGTVEFFYGEANFSFYERLYEEDSRRACGLRKCPKLTKSHIFPNSFEKMVVPLATQLFSRSVATGLKFYREMGVEAFQQSESTELFTQELNDVFDALNARYTAVGVRLNDKHYNALKNFESLLDEYIFDMMDNKYGGDVIPFASSETLIALKVTISSTLEVVDHLIRDLDYSYVLTGKITQDCLERFFGIIRGAGGREDHPTVTNFIQLFRLLSLYNPVKRILRGNVRSDDDDDVLVPFENYLRDSAKNGRHLQKKGKKLVEERLLNKLRELEQLGSVYSEQDSGLDSLLDKNIIYHLSGFLCFKAKKLLKCDQCIMSLSCSNPEVEECSTMTDILNYGGLHHPKRSLFQAVVQLEKAVCESIRVHTACGDIILDCISRLSLEPNIDLGCGVSSHLEDIVIALFPYYITMRLHFFAKSKRNELGHGKATRNKRKESKLKS